MLNMLIIYNNAYNELPIGSNGYVCYNTSLVTCHSGNSVRNV